MSSLAKQAKPLLFLTFRSFFNGIKRSLTTPRRLISLILFVGYYFMFFVRPAMGPSRMPEMPNAVVGQFEFPPLVLIDAVSWTILAALSMLLLMGVTSANAGYKPADVDMLFPTPISPKTLLIFRIFRDYLITLFLPLFVALLGLRPARMGWEAVFRNMPNPEYSGMTLRFLLIAWMLMSLGWVMISYAVSLFVNRSDQRADFNRRMVAAILFLVFLGVAGYIGWTVYRSTDWQDLVRASQHPALRTVFFMASLANLMVLAPFTGAMGDAAIGAAGLLVVCYAAFRVSMSQAHWMYDQAAIKAFNKTNVRELQRSGDLIGMAAERAKSKGGKRKATFVNRWVMRGPWALIWKDILIQGRSMMGIMLILGTISIGLGIMPALIPVRSGRAEMAVGPMILVMQLTIVFMITMNIAMGGAIEVLKRVDLQRPLPFLPWQIVFMEVASKAVLVFAPVVISLIVTVILKPVFWAYAAAALLAVFGVSLLMSACVFLTTLLFPDVDDPTQRQFRGLVMMISFVIFGFFPIGAMVGLLALKLHPVFAGAVAGGMGLAISVGLAVVSGYLYSNFNPTE